MKFGFTTLITDRFEATVAFYRDIMGFEVFKEYSPNPDTSIAFLKNNENRIEIVQNKQNPAADNSKSAIQMTFIADDIDEAYSRMKTANVEGLSEPVKFPNGLQMFRGKDPNGVNLGFVKEP